MARTNIPLSLFAANASVADPATTPIDQANGMVVSGGRFRKLVLRVTNSAAGPHVVTARAGANPLAQSAGQGDLAVTVAAGATVWIGPLESARFSQKDGSINVDFDAGTTGAITAMQLPARY